VVTAFDQVEFCMPVQWLACPVHEGSFSVESDRKDVREFVATSLDFKLQRLAKEKDMNLYRRTSQPDTNILRACRSRQGLDFLAMGGALSAQVRRFIFSLLRSRALQSNNQAISPRSQVISHTARKLIKSGQPGQLSLQECLVEKPCEG
ncbi:unnamed protein product, partial [Effrenium voratum]